MPRYNSIVPRLAVNDLRRAIDFYTGTLGFTVDLLWPDDQPTFAILVRDEVTLQLYTPEAPPPAPARDAMLCIDVDYALAVHDALAGRLTIEWGPEVYTYGRREFAVRDPEGYLLIIGEDTDDAPTLDEP